MKDTDRLAAWRATDKDVQSAILAALKAAAPLATLAAAPPAP